jgi:Ca2+-binding RTX toxin-like protein
LYVVGGYGDDKIFSGSDRDGDIYIWGDNRTYYIEDASPGDEYVWTYGFENDGNDIIDIEDNPGSNVYGYAQGGDDKLIGSVQGADAATEKLYGGDGDDKIWLLNPGQVELADSDDTNYGYGGAGNDIIYGDNRAS